ncbi:MAG: hypothetical protein FWB71_03680 [Defluviitaleaceae bacterium]|nr:hypothetical protein [Defluviitaleaceae bacterium]
MIKNIRPTDDLICEEITEECEGYICLIDFLMKNAAEEILPEAQWKPYKECDIYEAHVPTSWVVFHD